VQCTNNTTVHSGPGKSSKESSVIKYEKGEEVPQCSEASPHHTHECWHSTAIVWAKQDNIYICVSVCRAGRVSLLVCLFLRQRSPCYKFQSCIYCLFCLVLCLSSFHFPGILPPHLPPHPVLPSVEQMSFFVFFASLINA
jgi:hypothetical protein